ncbi:unnamed protein product [Phytophthora lilii]|uniref:Unnamed protein product n=1 Tax=Phytophthora lilii TaxID=2077276 RepID=A0A9W6X078_9STRA|nr:unnamed protein product [Phytophthora lilii]
MTGVKLVFLGAVVSLAAVQAIPWWSDIGAAHGAKAMPLTLAQLSGQFGRRDSEVDQSKGFPWRSLEQNDDADDSLHIRSRKLPPFDVLDANGDYAVDADEWTGYVNKLFKKAAGIINQGSDPVATKFLLDITKFHYDNLDSCIKAELTRLSSTDFTEITTEIEHHCYIKFRYSLFAGPPPFELVTNSAPTAPAHDIETWFTIQIDIARHDLENGRVLNLDEVAELHLEQLVACAHKKLSPLVNVLIGQLCVYCLVIKTNYCCVCCRTRLNSTVSSFTML